VKILEAPGSDVIEAERAPPVQLSAVLIVTDFLIHSFNNFFVEVITLPK
tara:strand:- start:311 stop:457 length:147 start_codon:yes stop_codon:yes gene_type:complete